MPGLYLDGSGVKRRVIKALDGLGVTEGYRALANSKTALSTRLTVCIGSLRMVAASANVYGNTGTLQYNIIRPVGHRSDITVFYDNFNYMQLITS